VRVRIDDRIPDCLRHADPVDESLREVREESGREHGVGFVVGVRFGLCDDLRRNVVQRDGRAPGSGSLRLRHVFDAVSAVGRSPRVRQRPVRRHRQRRARRVHRDRSIRNEEESGRERRALDLENGARPGVGHRRLGGVRRGKDEMSFVRPREPLRDHALPDPPSVAVPVERRFAEPERIGNPLSGASTRNRIRSLCLVEEND
jgi:hypothetical protein